MRPEDWQRMSWHARMRMRRLNLQPGRRTPARTPVGPRSIPDMARAIAAALPPDPLAALHVDTLHHYDTRPRKRTA